MHDDPTPLHDPHALSEQYERACAVAARLYAEGKDTTEADAEVERLHALLVAAGRA